MSSFARRKITNQDTVCDDDDDATPTRPNGHYIISNGSVPLSPTLLLSPPGSLTEEPDSPEFYRTKSYDEVLFDIRKISPADIAAQMTLLDLPLFRAIQIEEFRGCGWNKKDKLKLAPNIAAFTKKFNHTSFWVVQEVLKEPILKVRSEVVTHFIKIAKKLLDLNNLHSLTAVVSALQSTAVFRLAQTWKCVHKKERVVFDKLQEFVAETDNWRQLREHVDAARLPCIPHLAIYLTDLTYLHTLPKNVAKKSARQVESVLNLIAYCQNSCYDELMPEVHIQKYLRHTRYIDELLKFFEEEQYQLSLKREPDLVQLRRATPTTTLAKPSSALRTSKSHEDLLTPFTSAAAAARDHTPSSPAPSSGKMWTPQPQPRTRALRHTLGDGNSEELKRESLRLSAILNDDDLLGDCVQVTVYQHSPDPVAKGRSFTLPREGEWPPGNPFHPAPSSSSSSSSSSAASSSSNVLGSEGAGTPVMESSSQPPPSAPPVVGRRPGESPSQWHRRHRKSFSVGTNVLAVLGIGKSSKQPSSSSTGSPELVHQQTTLSLIDDSVLDTTFTTGTSYSGTPTGSMGNLSSSCSSESLEGVGLEGDEEEEGTEDLMINLVDLSNTIKEGFLKRKVVRKHNKSVSLARRKVKYWVQLTGSSLILHSSRPKHKKSGKEKVKSVPLRECRLKYRDPTERTSDKVFVVVDCLGNRSKYSAKTSSLAQAWVDKIRDVISREEERLRQEVEKSLIKL